jgi:hypothetical protein
LLIINFHRRFGHKFIIDFLNILTVIKVFVWCSSVPGKTVADCPHLRSGRDGESSISGKLFYIRIYVLADVKDDAELEPPEEGQSASETSAVTGN